MLKTRINNGGKEKGVTKNLTPFLMLRAFKSCQSLVPFCPKPGQMWVLLPLAPETNSNHTSPAHILRTLIIMPLHKPNKKTSQSPSLFSQVIFIPA